MVSKKKNKKIKFQSFQDTILNLQKYWSKHGCVILQPYDLEIFDTISGFQSFDNLIDYLATNDSIATNDITLSDENVDYFRINLPTNINLAVDYHIWNDFYVDARAIIGFQRNNDPSKVRLPSVFTITPRYDYKYIGVSLPLSYSGFYGFRTGVGLRFGPLVVGVADIKPLFAPGKDKNIKGANIYAGVRFWLFNKHPKDNDKDKVSNREDECIDLAGVWEFKGCPDTDGDGILDSDDDDSVNPDSGTTIYELDSLMGNSNAKFKLKVSELDYYLRVFDPASNFEQFQQYYSNNEIPSSFSGTVLFDDEIEINSKELVFWKEDDPETPDEDESEAIKERLTPRIRVSLDKDFFQKKIIDNEGSQDLANNDNFKLFIKGLVIKAYDFSDPLLMILNFSEAEVRLVYGYQKYDKKDTPDDTSDDVVEESEEQYKLKMEGYKINSFKNDPYPASIYTEVYDTINNPKSVYLKGGEGVMAEIELFKNNDGIDVLEEIRAKQWLVNEANLSMYIDKEMLSLNGGIIEPSRLYLYDIENKAPVLDYFIDNSTGPKESENKVIHGGLIELDEDDKGLMYKIRISEHIKNIIRKDSTNVRLGLVVSSDISSSMNTEVEKSDLMTFIPSSSVINPLGTVLIGPSPSAENYSKRMRLNLYYTEVNND